MNNGNENVNFVEALNIMNMSAKFQLYPPHPVFRRLAESQMVKGRIIGRPPNSLDTEKSELIPSQDFVYIEMNFRTDLGIVRVPEDRMNSIICLYFKISRQAVITARKYLSLLGNLNSTADLVILGRLHMRSLQFYLLAK